LGNKKFFFSDPFLPTVFGASFLFVLVLRVRLPVAIINDILFVWLGVAPGRCRHIRLTCPEQSRELMSSLCFVIQKSNDCLFPYNDSLMRFSTLFFWKSTRFN
jgi:hypothetical protein